MFYLLVKSYDQPALTNYRGGLQKNMHPKWGFHLWGGAEGHAPYIGFGWWEIGGKGHMFDGFPGVCYHIGGTLLWHYFGKNVW